jgi:hypothetical protein
MNWEVLAAIGQIAAAYIGIHSIIYLAVQIRVQTRERRQSAVNALTVHWGDLTKSRHDNADFCAIYSRWSSVTLKASTIRPEDGSRSTSNRHRCCLTPQLLTHKKEDYADQCL